MKSKLRKLVKVVVGSDPITLEDQINGTIDFIENLTDYNYQLFDVKHSMNDKAIVVLLIFYVNEKIND